MLEFRRSCLSAVDFGRGFHVLSNVFEIGTIHLRPLRVRLQKVVPNVCTGNVDIRPDIVQNMILKEITASDRFIVVPKLPEYPERIDSGQGHDEQETAKSDQQSQAGTEEYRVWTSLTRTKRTDLIRQHRYLNANRACAPAERTTCFLCEKYQTPGMGPGAVSIVS